MKNFFRIVQLTLRRRYTFAAAIACSIGVALSWGGNLALLKPVIDVVFSHGKLPHTMADEKLAELKEKLAKTDAELESVDAELATADPKKQAALEGRQKRLANRRIWDARVVSVAEYL